MLHTRGVAPCQGKPLCAPASASLHTSASSTRLHGAAGMKFGLIDTTPSLQRLVSALHRSTAIASLTRRAEDGLVATDVPTYISAPRTSIRMGLPSKGRMSEDTMTLMKECALSVNKINPRQYVAKIPQLPALEVWFQRASDVVRKVRSGDLDLGIVGGDMCAELADNDPNVMVIHDALNFGHCKVALGIPMAGKYLNIHTLDDLRSMPDWTAKNPLRVVTGYQSIAKRYFAEKGFQHVVLVSADGALEAAPAMGSADIILDLVSTGVTLRENNLKEIQGGDIMESQGVLVANRESLMQRDGVLPIVHELIERFEAHLKAEQFYSVIANMKGDSPEAVAAKLMQTEELRGLQGPTISSVYDMSPDGSAAQHGFYAATICVRKKKLYSAVKCLQKLGGSGVLVMPMTYIFDKEPQRWTDLLDRLGLKDEDVFGSK